jgi:hypothetical protein
MLGRSGLMRKNLASLSYTNTYQQQVPVRTKICDNVTNPPDTTHDFAKTALNTKTAASNNTADILWAGICKKIHTIWSLTERTHAKNKLFAAQQKAAHTMLCATFIQIKSTTLCALQAPSLT